MEKLSRKFKKAGRNIDLNRNIVSVVLLVGYLILTAIYFM